MTDRDRMSKLSKYYSEYLNGQTEQDRQPIDGYDNEFYDGVLWAYSKLEELYSSDEEETEDAFWRRMLEPNQGTTDGKSEAPC